jgi:hypothetical protein
MPDDYADGSRACSRCGDEVATLGMRDECDACSAAEAGE